MKKILLLYISISIALVSASAQNKTNYITVAYGDSVKLHINTETGYGIQWQTSTDRTTWTNIQDARSVQYGFIPSTNAYYRTQISIPGCGQFLSDTVYVTSFKKSPEVLTSDELSVLIKQCYISGRYWYGKETGYIATENATDIYTYGSGATGLYLDIYKSQVTQELASLALLWNELYRGVMNCNAAVHYIHKSGFSDADKLEYEAEVRFLRAFYLWHIVETWGGTVFVSGWEPINSGTAKLAPVDTFYKQIFSDFGFAESNLSNNSASNTVLSKNVAKAFLARMYLTRKDYSQAYNYALQVINSNSYSLISDISKLWDVKNGQNTEVIYALDNSIYPDPAISYLQGVYSSINPGGFQGHAFFNCKYDIMPGLLRTVEYGRPFARYCPTRFLVELYNPQLDNRFAGYFRTAWICVDSSSVMKWPSQINIDGTMVSVDPAKVGKRMFVKGDTALVLFPKAVPNTQKALISGNYYHPVRGYRIFDINDLYDAVPRNRNQYFPIMGKMGDPFRFSVSEVFSSRNSYLIRLSEMYLIAAEAALEQGMTMEAYTYTRALANKNAVNGNGDALLAAYGVYDPADVKLNFILDERARELAGEQLRWFDLKRTGKLVERVKLHNPDYTNDIMEFHNLRPIPPAPLITFGDLTVQNPGY
jgi:hypothetical protein